VRGLGVDRVLDPSRHGVDRLGELMDAATASSWPQPATQGTDSPETSRPAPAHMMYVTESTRTSARARP
jgi:hypothetical protein